MKVRTVSKLKISRETLRDLESFEIAADRGGPHHTGHLLQQPLHREVHHTLLPLLEETVREPLQLERLWIPGETHAGGARLRIP